ncbi:MAG TPA: DUF2520 domain-containing protein [Chloroflexota bacterium]|nr:DUF2520 domain-containing protein [Chloroflexota bacterium]
MSSGKPRPAFVGAGRVANVLAPALERAGYPVVAVASRSEPSAERLAGRLARCHVIPVEEAADTAEVVFLTVPDDAIAEAAARIRWRPGSAAVHCSGATEINVLARAAELGAEIGGFHPLQTFAGADAELTGIRVAIEAEGRLRQTLQEMAASLGCTPLELRPGDRALYHASGAFAHNYWVTLFREAVRLWGLLGYSEAEALNALLPLARASLSNVERLGVAGALTGPIARGDAGTVRRHIDALRERAPDLLPLYLALGRQTVPLAKLQPSVIAELESILSDKETSSCV